MRWNSWSRYSSRTAQDYNEQHDSWAVWNQQSKFTLNGRWQMHQIVSETVYPIHIHEHNGYLTYKRRDTGVTYQLKPNSPKVDNSWVVPYNRYLSLKYSSHINLEFCASITSVQYIFKYVCKEHDCANIETRTGEFQGRPTIVWDEISSFLDKRCVSAPEASWDFSNIYFLTDPMPFVDWPCIFLKNIWFIFNLAWK